MKLVTKRLILRDPTIKDAKSIRENINDILVSKYMATVPYPYKIKDVKWFINECEKEIKKRPRVKYNLGIELKSEKKVIGGIGLNVDRFNKTGTAGYWIGRKYWRKGITTEAFKKLLDFAFNKLKLRRMNMSAYTKNKPSNNLIKKFGFKKEGMKREVRIARSTGKIRDENIYGLLRKEYKPRKIKISKKK